MEHGQDPTRHPVRKPLYLGMMKPAPAQKFRHSPLKEAIARQGYDPARAVFTLHSDESQSLISGQGGVAVPGDLPPEPSRAVSMKTIPAPPHRHEFGMPASWRQALLAQHLNGRVA